MSSRSDLNFSAAFLAAALPLGLTGENASSSGSGVAGAFFLPLLAGLVSSTSTSGSGSGLAFLPLLPAGFFTGVGSFSVTGVLAGLPLPLPVLAGVAFTSSSVGSSTTFTAFLPLFGFGSSTDSSSFSTVFFFLPRLGGETGASATSSFFLGRPRPFFGVSSAAAPASSTNL